MNDAEGRQQQPQRIDDGLVALGYEVWRDGTFQGQSGRLSGTEPSVHVDLPLSLYGSRKKITGRALWIAEIGKTIDTDEPLVKLGFMTLDLRPSYIWVDRGVITDAKKLVALGGRGLPVSSDNVRDIVRYLIAAESLTGKHARMHLVGHRTGPYDLQEGRGYLLGDRWIGPGHLDSDPRTKPRYCAGLRASGSSDEWLMKYREMYDMNWVCRFLLATTFAPALLRYCKQRTFIIHQWGTSSMGKTALMTFGLSAWGDPAQLRFSFAATRNAITEGFRHFTDTPFCVDESMLQNDDDFRAHEFIMLTCNDAGKERVEKDGGLRKSIPAWLTVVRTTGEKQLVEDTDLGGQANRVLQISASALPNEEYSSALYGFSAQHHGHAGPAFMEQLVTLINSEGGQQGLLNRYKDVRATITANAKPGTKRNHIDYVAVIAVAQALSAIWLLGIDQDKAWATAVKDAGYALQDSDPGTQQSLPEKVLGILKDHWKSNPFEYGDETSHAALSKTEKGHDGRRHLTGFEHPAGMAYFPDTVDSLLRFKNLPPGRIWKDFATLGWLIVAPGERTHTYVTVRGSPGHRVYCIRREVFMGDMQHLPVPTIERTAIVASERLLNGEARLMVPEPDGTLRLPDLNLHTVS